MEERDRDLNELEEDLDTQLIRLVDIIGAMSKRRSEDLREVKEKFDERLTYLENLIKGSSKSNEIKDFSELGGKISEEDLTKMRVIFGTAKLFPELDKIEVPKRGVNDRRINIKEFLEDLNIDENEVHQMLNKREELEKTKDFFKKMGIGETEEIIRDMLEKFSKIDLIFDKVTIKELFHKGVEKLKQTDYDGAYTYFNSITEKNPEIKEAWLNKGIASAMGGKQYLFSIDAAELEKSSIKEVILEELKKEFETKRFLLSENTTIRKEKEDEWVLTDEEKIYIIKIKVGKLNIYGKHTEISCYRKALEIDETYEKTLRNLEIATAELQRAENQTRGIQ
jgi:tetratricopeptide (TPR) repeat protein